MFHAGARRVVRPLAAPAGAAERPAPPTFSGAWRGPRLSASATARRSGPPGWQHQRPQLPPQRLAKRGAVRRRRPGPAWRVSPRARRNSAGARRGPSQESVPVAVIKASGPSPSRTRDDHGLTRSFAKWLRRASGKAAGQGHRGSARLESGLPASGTRTDSAWRGRPESVTQRRAGAYASNRASSSAQNSTQSGEMRGRREIPKRADRRLLVACGSWLRIGEATRNRQLWRCWRWGNRGGRAR